MPTAHRRINVTCDPELTSALEATRAALGEDVPDATRLRELALAGAAALRAGDPATGAALLRRQLRSHLDAVRPAPADSRRLSWLAEDAAPGSAGSDALAWARGDR